MTIAAGFVCSDGVLLASDTLYSNTGMGLRYGPKFWILDHGDVLVVFGGAGTETVLLRTRDEIARKLKPGMSRIAVVDRVDDALKKVADKVGNNPSLMTQGLVAIRIQSEVVLYEMPTGVMLNPIGDCCQCVGYGQSLGWYFAKSLFKAGMNLGWAKIVAAHLIRNTKDYSESCGGDTHLIEIPNTGPARKIDQQGEIASLENYLRPIDDVLRMVLPGNDPNASDLTLRKRFQVLNDAISAARGLAVSVGMIHSTAQVYAPAIDAAIRVAANPSATANTEELFKKSNDDDDH